MKSTGCVAELFKNVPKAIYRELTPCCIVFAHKSRPEIGNSFFVIGDNSSALLFTNTYKVHTEQIPGEVSNSCAKKEFWFLFDAMMETLVSVIMARTTNFEI